jgi:hypothetical protein
MNKFGFNTMDHSELNPFPGTLKTIVTTSNQSGSSYTVGPFAGNPHDGTIYSGDPHVGKVFAGEPPFRPDPNQKWIDMVQEILKAISSRMEEKANGPGIALLSHVQDYQHVIEIARKYGAF